MKKQILLFLFLLVNIIFTSAQVTILMEKDGGVYKVPCTVNGVKMKFIFDTGASTVSMSQTMAQFLLDGDYLSVNDIKGVGQSVVADGSIVNHAEIILRDIEIGGLHLKNILATVLDSQNAALLLGQTAINELGRITIDGNKLIIHKSDRILTDEQIKQLEEQVDLYLDAQSFAAATECLERLDEANVLSELGLWQLCFCYCMNDQADQCIQSCNRWLVEYEESGSSSLKCSIFGYLALSYCYVKNDYSKALLWYQKELALLEDEKDVYKNKSNQARCYLYLNNAHQAEILFLEYLKYKEKQLGYLNNNKAYQKIVDGMITNEDLGNDYYFYGLIQYGLHNEEKGDLYVSCASQLGCNLAKEYCRNNGLKFKYSKVKWNWQ